MAEGSVADKPQRVLIVRPSALGDVARTVGALVSLKRAMPGARIDWLVRDDFADAIRHHPDLHAVVPFPRRRFRRFGVSPSVTIQVFRYLRDLRRAGYGAAYDLQGLGRSGLFTWATGAPKRIGGGDARELAWLGYTKKVAVRAGLHAVDQMMAVLAGDGIEPVYDLRLHVGEADRAWASHWLKERAIEADGYAVLAPTAAWLSKRWPIDRFATAAGAMPALGLQDVVVVGSGGERDQTAGLFGEHRALTGEARLHDLVGGTTVGQLMAIIERAGVVLCNDSAASHLAAGLGRRLVAVFGPTDPALTAPYRYDDRFVIRPRNVPMVHYRANRLDQRIIAAVSVEQVIEALRCAMRTAPPSPNGEPAGRR